MTQTEKKTVAPGTTAVVPTIDDAREPVFVLLAKRSYDIKPNAVPTPAAEARAVDARAWAEDVDFSDTHHLLASGARRFTERLGYEALGPAVAAR